MSWRASAWAKEQRLGSPAAKSILLCLADYADPDKAQCWPSQTQLAADAEVSERTAREWLQRLEEWGLIGRERRTRDNGARATDMIVLKLSARVLDGAQKCRELKESDAEDGTSLPAEIAGRTLPAADAEPTGNECTPTGNQCRASIEEPSNRTSQGTSQPGAQAREREGVEDRKKAEGAYWRLIRAWPQLSGQPKDNALKAFLALSPDERAEAEIRFPGWLALLKAQGRDHVYAPSTYFAKKLWRDVPDPAAPVEPTLAEARPFGPLWAAVRFRALLQPPAPSPLPAGAFMAQLVAQDDAAGRAERLRRQAVYGWPTVNRMHEAALNRRGMTVEVALTRLERLMEPVPVDAPLFSAWQAEHEKRGWPWIPDPGAMKVVYFPAGGPGALGAFEEAVRREALIGETGKAALMATAKEREGHVDGAELAAE